MSEEITREKIKLAIIIIIGLSNIIASPYLANIVMTEEKEVNELDYDIVSGNYESTKSGGIYYDSAYLEDGNSSYAKVEIELKEMGERENVTFVIQSLFTNVMDIDKYGIIFGGSAVTKSTDIKQNRITFEEEGKKTLTLEESEGKYPRVAYRILEPEEVYDWHSLKEGLVRTFFIILGTIFILLGIKDYLKKKI